MGFVNSREVESYVVALSREILITESFNLRNVFRKCLLFYFIGWLSQAREFKHQIVLLSLR